MIARFPASTTDGFPLTGARRNATPCRSASAATVSETPGETVLMSTRVPPSAFASTPPGPSVIASSAAGSASMTMQTSARLSASAARRVPGRLAPRIQRPARASGSRRRARAPQPPAGARSALPCVQVRQQRPASRVTIRTMSRPRVHVTGRVPAAVDEALREDFELRRPPRRSRRDPQPADDGRRRCVPRARGQRPACRCELRGRREQHRPRGGADARSRHREHTRRSDANDRRARDHVDALAAASRHRGRPLHPRPPRVGVLARVHARREPRRQGLRRRRRGQDRPRDGASRRELRRPPAVRRAARTRWPSC